MGSSGSRFRRLKPTAIHGDPLRGFSCICAAGAGIMPLIQIAEVSGPIQELGKWVSSMTACTTANRNRFRAWLGTSSIDRFVFAGLTALGVAGAAKRPSSVVKKIGFAPASCLFSGTSIFGFGFKLALNCTEVGSQKSGENAGTGSGDWARDGIQKFIVYWLCAIKSFRSKISKIGFWL
jgi:hypothetical protein